MTDNHNKDQDRRLDKVEGHIETTNREMGEVQVDVAKIKTDVSWLKRNHWIVVTASLSAGIVGLVNLIFK